MSSRGVGGSCDRSAGADDRDAHVLVGQKRADRFAKGTHAPE